MDFRILGPLQVTEGGRTIPVSAPKQRVVLASLLLRPNLVVSAAELIERLWGADPPAGSRTTLQGYVLRLRRTLNVAGVIGTEPSGYLLRVRPDQIDLCRFEALLAAADQAAAEGDTGAEADQLRDALALWRGVPLADIESDSLRRDEGPRLAERWAVTLERRIDADLRLGRHLDLIPELAALVAAHPLREGLHAQRMLTLYRAGRRAEALAAYREARKVLVAELGIEPGARLRDLERAILLGDDLGPEPLVRRLHMLPCDVPDFVGREPEIGTLMSLLVPTDSPPICVVAGMAGVGKTTLAVHVAHRLTERYPGGQLYLDLAGAGTSPMDPGRAAERLLRLLGVGGAAVPDGLDERAALLRDRLAGRRVLLVLDNASDEAQVRPLLPGDACCGVIVTARSRLIGLAGAHLIDLEVFAADHAVELLSRIVGSERACTEPAAARTLVQLCGRLPLAVRIVAARLHGRPAWTLEALAGKLADEHHRLDRLTAGDLGVRSSLALSYRTLGIDHRGPFRLFGLLDGPDLPCWIVAALLDCPVWRAEELIEGLVDARLLEPAGRDGLGQDRYRCHDLVRLFAREQALGTDPPELLRSALARVFGALLTAASEADRCLPSRRLRLPDQAPPAAAIDPAVLELAGSAPLAWFETHHGLLIGAVDQAAEAGLPELSWRLAAVTLNVFDLRGLWSDWQRTHEAALPGCAGPAIRYGLGLLATARDRYREAAAHFEAARAATGCEVGAAMIMNAQGDVHHVSGRLDEAYAHFDEARRVFELHDDLVGRANAAVNIGLVHRDRGCRAEAMAGLESGLTLFHQAGDLYGEAHALRFLASTCHAFGDITGTREHAACAVDLFRRLGDGLAEARATRLLATAQGDAESAMSRLGECLIAFRDQGDPFGEASTLWSLGQAALSAGDPASALTYLTGALELFSVVGSPLWRARSLERIAAAHAKAGRADAARAAAEESIALLRKAGLPEEQRFQR
jgi:DNA-binding SARP family transcriptional activator